MARTLSMTPAAIAGRARRARKSPTDSIHIWDSTGRRDFDRKGRTLAKLATGLLALESAETRISVEQLIKTRHSQYPTKLVREAFPSFHEKVLLAYAEDTGNSSPSIPQRRIVGENKKRLRALRTLNITRARGFTAQEKKPAQPGPVSLGIEKDANTFDAMIIEGDFSCWACGHAFGDVAISPSQLREEWLMPEHGHATKARGEGGTAENDFPICSICQRLQGDGKGMPFDLYRSLCLQGWTDQNLRVVSGSAFENVLRALLTE